MMLFSYLMYSAVIGIVFFIRGEHDDRHECAVAMGGV